MLLLLAALALISGFQVAAEDVISGCMQCPPIDTTFKCLAGEVCDLELSRTVVKDGCLASICLNDRSRRRLLILSGSNTWMRTSLLICGQNKLWTLLDGSSPASPAAITCTTEPAVSRPCTNCGVLNRSPLCPPGRVCQMSELYTDARSDNGCKQMQCSAGLKLLVNQGTPSIWSTANYVDCDDNMKWRVNGNSSQTINTMDPHGITCADVCAGPEVEKTKLEQRCKELPPILKSAMVGNSCFVVTENMVTEPFATWENLYKYCNHIPGYRGRLANISTKAEQEALLASNIFPNDDDWAFIGGKQDPSDEGTCGTDLCGSPIHDQNWWLYDENGKKTIPVSPDLWVPGYPNNGDVSKKFSQNAIILWRTRIDSIDVLGFDDYSPTVEGKVLCQYGGDFF